MLLRLVQWDAAGSDKYKYFTDAYFKGACGVVVVYDVTNRESFDNLMKHLDSAEKNAPEGTPIILVGNKIDAKEKRIVRQENALDFAKIKRLELYEVSALTGENVDSAFNRIAQKIVAAFKVQPQLQTTPNTGTIKTSINALLLPPRF
eukprot:TRINITY_DN10798_c0_g2_i2.p2 TRINITY_DN10798_c0_g2~~TRINITY_DN10798_c0_g2_i2.p2  ORF type:complete len:148 (-),score=6.51 TRINITY_DN10798_c0_g2_i2:36-479(-)